MTVTLTLPSFVTLLIALVSAGFSIGLYVRTRDLPSQVAGAVATALTEPLAANKTSLNEIATQLGEIRVSLAKIEGRLNNPP